MLLAGSVLGAGCASVEAPSAAPELPAVPVPAPQGIVFCADGAGGFGGLTRAVQDGLAAQRVPLAVERVEWSHGYGRIISDQVDQCHAVAEGRCLAVRVAEYRARCPGKPVYFVAHSAGTCVVLTAAALLPAGSVEGIVLLAPSVSAEYDLRPALACVRGSIDVFYSESDWAALGLGIVLLGTADRRWAPAAGRTGFRVQCECPGDTALYARLRQHPWDPCDLSTGHYGGHYGSYRAGYLRTYVLPLLQPYACAPCGLAQSR
jgi:pimeloyl-ACP methyl ester carboxylesterase